MKILGVIPARYESTRLPGKVLMEIGGKSIIQMVYEQCLKSKSLSELVVATDSKLVLEHVQKFGGNAVLTSEKHPSGTDRCAEAVELLGGAINYDFVVNIQGDEPIINPENIDRMIARVKIPTEISSVYVKIKETEILLNPNVVKVVVDDSSDALYFSRSPIPHLRGESTDNWLNKYDYYKHMGIYGFRVDILEKIVRLPISRLEQIEKLEQLRWLSNGYKIKMVEVDSDSIGIDTMEDFERLKQFLSNK